MKILFTETEPWEKKFFEEQLKDQALTFWPSPLAADNLPPRRDFEALCVFVGSKIDRAVLDAFPNVKFIATRSTGFDHIDMAAAQERGIAVSTVPSYGEHTVAEYTFALILELARHVGSAYERVQHGGIFNADETSRGFDLSGKTIAVVGTGRIGKHVALIARGFNMKVLCCDSRPNPELTESGFSYGAFDEALPLADFITFHVPARPETFHMLNKERAAKLKKGVYIVNTSRGTVIDSQALIWGLKQGIVAGAALDVLEEEGILKPDAELAFLLTEHPNPEKLRQILSDQYLIDHPNVIITPHNAFNTHEALQRIAQTTLENIQGFLAGQPLNVVKTEGGRRPHQSKPSSVAII